MAWVSYADVILRPLITEKGNDGISSGWYTFKVGNKTSKTQIKYAVESLFSVEVVAVNTINCKGKSKRLGVHQGKTSKWKKAYVKINTNPTSKNHKNTIEQFVSA